VKSRDKVYPNAPLKEVVFEVRFPGEPAIECHRDEIFERVRKSLPKVFVPGSVSAKAPALQPYQFKTDDELRSLMVSLNSLGYSTKQYKGFEVFRMETLQLLNPVLEKFKIRKLNRVGLRYINLIPYMRQDESIPVGQLLRMSIEVPAGNTMPMQHLALQLSRQCNGGIITTNIQSVRSLDELREALLLDFDYGKTGDLDARNLERYLDEGHAHTKKLFESIVTDVYRKVMETKLLE